MPKLSDEQVLKQLKWAREDANPVGERHQALTRAIERFSPCECGRSVRHMGEWWWIETEGGLPRNPYPYGTKGCMFCLRRLEVPHES